MGKLDGEGQLNGVIRHSRSEMDEGVNRVGRPINEPFLIFHVFLKLVSSYWVGQERIDYLDSSGASG